MQETVAPPVKIRKIKQVTVEKHGIEWLAENRPDLLADQAAKPGTFSGLGARFVLGEIEAAKKEKKKKK